MPTKRLSMVRLKTGITAMAKLELAPYPVETTFAVDGFIIPPDYPYFEYRKIQPLVQFLPKFRTQYK